MIRRALRWSGVVLGLIVCTAAFLPSLVEAQGPLQPEPKQEELLGGIGDKLLPKETNRFGDMRQGNKPVIVPGNAKETEENKEVLQKAARFYAYRLTNTMYFERDKNAEGFSLNDLVNQAYDKILLVPEIRGKRTLKPEQADFLKAFGKEMHSCLREVLSKNAKPIVRVNATRMLAGLGEAGFDEVAGTLVDLIKNPNENDGVKLWALRGFKELFEINQPGKSIFGNVKTETPFILGLLEFLGRPRPASLSPEAPADEVAAVQFVRREAIRALANTRYPLVPNTKGSDGQTALWLLRVLNKRHMDPEPSIGEQAEAAIGLCQLQVALTKDYQLDYVASQVGAFLLDFIKTYNDQRATKAPTIPWKWYAVRLTLALELLQAQTKSAAAAKGGAEYVDKFMPVAKKALRDVELDKDANPNELDEFLRGRQPASKELIKGVSEAILKTGQP